MAVLHFPFQGRHVIAVVAGVIASFATMTLSHATTTEVKGGPGGGPFNLTCPAGQFLVGFHARAGAWVDAVGIICAVYNASTGRLEGMNREPRMTGGRGGGPQEAYCPVGEPIRKIGLAHTRGGGLPRQYVNTIDFFCAGGERRCISTGEGCGFIRSKVAGSIIQKGVDYKYDELACPAEERATGIHGGAGIYVDSIGLICGPLKASAAASSQPAPASSKPIKITGRPRDGEPGSKSRPPVQFGFEMPGKEYRQVATSVWGSCQDLCQKETQCKAWSWFAPAVRGSRAMCSLKNDIPARVKNAKAASGVK